MHLHFYLSVNVFSTKVLIGDTIFHVSNWRRDRHAFYAVIRATRRSSRLQCKGSTFISRLFYDPEYWSGPRSGNRDLPLCSQHALPSELTLPRLSAIPQRSIQAWRRRFTIPVSIQGWLNSLLTTCTKLICVNYWTEISTYRSSSAHEISPFLTKVIDSYKK